MAGPYDDPGSFADWRARQPQQVPESMAPLAGQPAAPSAFSEFAQALKPVLMPLLMGTAGALTSDSPSPLKISGRALTGVATGLGMQQRQEYYEARMQHEQAVRAALAQQMRDRETYAKTIKSEDDRKLFWVSPEKYAEKQISQMNAGLSRKLAAEAWGLDPDKLPSDPDEFNRVIGRISEHDWKSKHPLQKLQVIQGVTPPGYNAPQDIVYDLNGNKVVTVIGPHMQGDGKVSPRDAVIKKALTYGEKSLNPEELKIWKKASEQNLTLQDYLFGGGNPIAPENPDSPKAAHSVPKANGPIDLGDGFKLVPVQ